MLHCGRFELSLERPLIMGIVNITPDSFHEASRHSQADQAISHARRLLEEGADLIDLGAESTRPGASPVSPLQEWQRLAPVLEALRGFPVPLSVDTRRAEVMRLALAQGADMINDVGGFTDPDSVQAVAGSRAALCIMHMAGEPSTMQEEPVYRDVVAEVRDFLHSRVQALCAAGVDVKRILLDPGIGFGKRDAHNIGLLRHLRQLTLPRAAPDANTPVDVQASSRQLPLLVGLSRKTLIGHLTGRATPDRLAGSLAGALAALALGAAIVRVHDVAATRDALAVWQAIDPLAQWADNES
ncbi:MAG: dihydropteroate synthase [Burkholderiales bacterium]|nr:dihydropteroate synthase [Burkholderiales bacterium]